LVEPIIKQLELREQIESKATGYAIAHLVAPHLQEVKQRKEELINKTITAVKDRLTKEINYWDQRSVQLRLQEQSGKTNARLNSAKAQQRADELASRLQKRLIDLEQERQLSPLPPVVVGGALIIPAGLLQQLQGKQKAEPGQFAKETRRVEQLAMAAVMATERSLGYEPQDVSTQKCGYDIESRPSSSVCSGNADSNEGSRLRFIEVKGRIAGADTVTVTKNEILTALNKPENYILALVQVPKVNNLVEGDTLTEREGETTCHGDIHDCVVRYIQSPFHREPDFGACSVNYDWKELWEQGREPA
jgi:hypothetical protein